MCISMEKRKKDTFMKRMEKVILMARKIMDTGDYDAMQKARIYL